MTSKAMVLAAGLGVRMRPLTEHLPKPLVPVAGVPLVDRTLDWLAASGVEEAVVNSYYLADMLEAHLAKRHSPRVLISHEHELLETGGGIRKALPLLGDAPFFIANSDVICIDGVTPALQRLRDRWDDSMDALLLVHKVSDAVGYDGQGDFFVGNEGRIRRRTASETAPYVFTGIQILHPRLFADTPEGPFSLNLLYNRAMSNEGASPRIAALVHDGHWLHVGDPAGVTLAEAWLSTHK